jgi:hypothetical protein
VDTGPRLLSIASRGHPSAGREAGLCSKTRPRIPIAIREILKGPNQGASLL